MSGFLHGKNTRVYIDEFDLSRYFNEAMMMGKVEVADTTTFAISPGISVSKTVIPGVKDGTLQFKGLFDSTPSNTAAGTSGVDNYFYTLVAQETGGGNASLVPTNVESCLSVSPGGSWAPGSRVWAAAGVASQYQISAPVKNAVSITADIQCDGGVETGVSLHDPGVNDAIPTTVNVAAGIALPTATLTVSAAPSTYPTAGTILVPNGANSYATIAYTSVTLVSPFSFNGCTGGTGTTTAGAVLGLIPGTGVNDESIGSGAATTTTVAAGVVLTAAPFTLTVTPSPITAGFPTNGQIVIPTSGGSATLSYSGITATSFTGVTGGAGQTTTAGNVTLPPIATITGAYGFLHLGPIAGAGGGLAAAKLQNSDDNTTWTDVPNGAWSIPGGPVGQFGSGQNAGLDGPGGYILSIPRGTSILRYVRVVLAYDSGSTAGPILVTFIRL